MIRMTAQFECVVDGKRGFFYIDQDASTAIAKEMCFQFQKFVGQIEDNAKALQESAEKPIEEPKEEDKGNTNE